MIFLLFSNYIFFSRGKKKGKVRFFKSSSLDSDGILDMRSSGDDGRWVIFLP